MKRRSRRHRERIGGEGVFEEVFSPSVSASVVGSVSAQGVMPHARGMIRVSWERAVDGTLTTQVDAPDGVLVR